jgi:isopentenyldiphosphate isomerase
MSETGPFDYVAVVDEYDRPRGGVPKSELSMHPGLHFRTAHAFIFRDSNLLLQQLAPRRDRHPLQYGSSVACFVRPNESYEYAIFRRCSEELGLDLAPKAVGKTQMPDFGGTKHITLFIAETERQDVVIEEPEHIADLVWLPLEDVARLTGEQPWRFTPTFLWLFHEFYGDKQRIAV